LIVAVDLASQRQAAVVCDHDSVVLARRMFRGSAWCISEILAWAGPVARKAGFAGAALLHAVDLEELDQAAGNNDSENADRLYDGGKLVGSRSGFPSLTPPRQWRPRPGWGTVRDYVAVTLAGPPR
jgi:hypothetical protein